LPQNVVAMTPPLMTSQDQVVEEGWSPSRADLQSLGRVGKSLVSAWREVHILNLREGMILMAAARCRDAAALWHRRSRAKGPTQPRFARLALAFEKECASLLAGLKVTE
jgi:hypothetical protein